ncbi:MAG: hypothetical protein J0H94_21140 [Rhizobiales bacterium]|nr:hypothetical protein [Rhizobium tropici]MBN8997722.1 hypothetical protein [Hyphomicrobiales bacterium]MBN9489956.1 hypothetical protein [Alphaproteobacteria bacterium]
MAELRVPSVQHLARNWRDEPAAIARLLVRLALNPPRFNYNPLYLAVRDLLVLRVPYEQVAEGIRRKVKNEKVRNNLLSVLPLIRDHFAGVSPDFYQTIDKRYYPVGRGLMVPFEPPMIYGVGGQLYFPWFSFWRRNPLARERLSLFVTLVDEVLMQDPDLETARFEILDFSCPGPKAPRTLTVLDARDIPRMDEARKTQMLEAFAEGYFQALATLAGTPPPPEDRDEPPPPDPDQPGLFD